MIHYKLIPLLCFLFYTTPLVTLHHH